MAKKKQANAGDRDDAWLRAFVARVYAESEECTRTADRTYPHPQQHLQRTAHLDWHRGYRAALREVLKEWDKRRDDGAY